MNPGFWKGRPVLLTGHTGFKGAWLALWLERLGATVTGYALAPPTEPSLYELAGVGERMRSIQADIRDLARLRQAMDAAQPQVVLHLAAQSLVRLSYQEPLETYATNVMGTAHVLEAARHCASVKVVLVVTSDKCYENREREQGYREDEAMGGYDPYSSSKGCAELVTAAYRRSFLDGKMAVASARAGNVIGGGDWARDRLVTDAIAAFADRRPVMIRNPGAIRPWQHVLDLLAGYLLLAERLWADPAAAAGAWNFGPPDQDVRPVSWVAERLARAWGDGASWNTDAAPHPHEAGILKLDCAKARTRLGWQPRLDLDTALGWIVEWYRAWQKGDDVRKASEEQIRRFEALAS